MNGMKRRLAVPILVAALAAAFLPDSSAMAAETTVAAVAGYTGADREAFLEAGAKKEGSLLVYTIGTQSDPMFKRFQEIYPYVRLEVFRAPTPEITRRVIEEYKVGRHTADVLDISTSGLQAMRDERILQPYHSPEASAYAPDAREPNKLWVFDYEAYVGLGFNTRDVPPEIAPRTYDDLLDPRWKGRMTVSDNGSTLPNWVGATLLTKGEDYLRRLGRQDVRVYAILGRALSNLVVSGEAPLSPLIYNSHMKNSRAKGATVDWRALGPVYANVNAVALARNAPHPHASMLYIDFTLSKEGQTMRVEIGDDSARIDLAPPDKPKEILYLSERPNYAAEYERWTDLSKQIFAKGKALPEKN